MSEATPAAALPTLDPEKHAVYIEGLDRQTDTFEYWVTEHLRVSGAYWGLSAMFLLGKEDMMEKDRIVTHVAACQAEGGGFGGNIGHDPHMVYTLSAVQILILYDRLDAIDVDAVVSCMQARLFFLPLFLNPRISSQCLSFSFSTASGVR